MDSIQTNDFIMYLLTQAKLGTRPQFEEYIQNLKTQIINNYLSQQNQLKEKSINLEKQNWRLFLIFLLLVFSLSILSVFGSSIQFLKEIIFNYKMIFLLQKLDHPEIVEKIELICKSVGINNKYKFNGLVKQIGLLDYEEESELFEASSENE